MNFSNRIIKQTVLATAVATALGTTAVLNRASAANLTFSFEGAFTLLNPIGSSLANPDFPSVAPWYTNRTPITGGMSFNTSTGTGTGTVVPFSFQGGGVASATTITFQAIGNGFGGPGNLVLGNMGFNWSGSNGIPVSIVLNAEGLFGAIASGNLDVGETIGGQQAPGSDFNCGSEITCASPASDGLVYSKYSYTLPVGPSPAATTTWNTANVGGGGLALGDNPSGTLPLTNDTIGGSPMGAGPFPGWNANFDFTKLTLDSDGSGDITAPADQMPSVNQAGPNPKQINVDLGHPTDVLPLTATAEYCLEDLAATCDTNDSWIADGSDTADNTIAVDITQNVNIKNVPWRSQVGGSGLALDTQTITATVADTVPPTIDSMPMNFSVNVNSTTDTVCFTNNTRGHLTASDLWTADPLIIWSLVPEFFPAFPNNVVENCSSEFGPNANTVFWRASDDANPSNVTPYEQTVTLVLPNGIVGKDCEIDLEYPDFRNTVGNFIMLNPQGAQTGTTDEGVTGVINTTLLCPDELCTTVGATLTSGQPFEGLDWFANPVRLFGPGDYSFDACPGDNSTSCGPPMSVYLNMHVDPGQLGAHMLFAWGSTQDIDVVVVWDVDCGSSMLTMTDPDGDGILGTPMVDGPFKGFNANFNISTAVGEPPIADGGFTTTVPVYLNPVAKESPPPLDNVELDASDLPNDPGAIQSCVGGCNRFSNVPTAVDATDGGGAYKQAYVVLPLRNNQEIPFWSKFRKLKNGNWQDFVVNSRNKVESSLRNTDGSCPEPGSADYSEATFNSQMKNKLEFGDGCIQLCIEDNGPNDSDNTVGIVEDDSGVAGVAGPPKPKAETTGSNNPFGGIGGSSGGGCSLSTAAIDPAKRADWSLMGGLLAVLGFFSLRRRRKQKH